MPSNNDNESDLQSIITDSAPCSITVGTNRAPFSSATSTLSLIAENRTEEERDQHLKMLKIDVIIRKI